MANQDAKAVDELYDENIVSIEVMGGANDEPQIGTGVDAISKKKRVVEKRCDSPRHRYRRTICRKRRRSFCRTLSNGLQRGRPTQPDEQGRCIEGSQGQNHQRSLSMLSAAVMVLWINESIWVFIQS